MSQMQLLHIPDEDQESTNYFVASGPQNNRKDANKGQYVAPSMDQTKTSGKSASSFCGSEPGGTSRQCCPTVCYKRRCVFGSAVISVLATIVCMGVLLGLSVSVAHPHLHVSNFVPGTCTVLSSNYTGHLGRCGCSQGGRSCLHTYPCLEIRVSYETVDGAFKSSILYATDEELSFASHCSIMPHCVAGSDNREDVESFRLKYGQIQENIFCFHHPTGTGAVVRRLSTPINLLHILIWPCIAGAISIVSCIFVFFHCVPRFCNKEF